MKIPASGRLKAISTPTTIEIDTKIYLAGKNWKHFELSPCERDKKQVAGENPQAGNTGNYFSFV
jgi:hypothetical protein